MNMLGFINKNKILAFFAAMAATQTLLYNEYKGKIKKSNERKGQREKTRLELRIVLLIIAWNPLQRLLIVD